MEIKERIRNNPGKYGVMFWIYNKIFGQNKIRVKGNSKVVLSSALLKKVNIYVEGEDNLIEIRQLTRMKNTSIFIKGNQNRLVIEKENGFEGSSLWMEDDENVLEVGPHNRFFKNSHLAVLEGTKIYVGQDGLFAPDVQIRTSDSHSILDKEGKRLNPARDIQIGNHVWMGAGASALKGSVIPDGCVIGMNSLVNRELDEKESLYVGSPVRKVKTSISWSSERIINKSE